MDALPLLLNERAGRGPDAATLERTFRDSGLRPAVEVVPPAGLHARLVELRGAPFVAVSGGDGSLRTAAAALLGSPTTLVPIPGGHLNHFARRLGLDSPAAAAVATASGRTRLVPVGVIGSGAQELVFLNTAVVGAYPYVIRMRERLRRLLGLWPAAVVAGLWVWLRWPLFDLTLRTRDRRLRERTAMVWIGAGPGTFPAPHEAPVPDEACLEVVLLRSTRRRHVLRLARAVWANRQGRDPHAAGLDVLRAPRLQLDAHHHIRLTLDAEPFVLQPPVTAALATDALRVVCAESGP